MSGPIDTGILLEMPEPRGPSMDVAESLRRFGTVAFGFEMMREYIRIGYAGRIDGSAWYAVVPEVYRSQIQPLIDSAAEKYIGRKLTDDAVREFVDDLNRVLAARLTSVPVHGGQL